MASDNTPQDQALLQSILDTAPDGLVVIDRAGTIRFFSSAAQRMFGFAADEVLGRNVKLLMPEPHAHAHDSYIDHYVETGERRIIGIGRTVVGRRKDGTTFPMELQIGEMAQPGARLFTGFVRDLTERQERDRRLSELQSELIHVSRLSELGQMVSALAHEVNQPLTAIANYVGGSTRLLGPDASPALRQALDKISRQAERARAIINSLRGLVRREPDAPAVQNLRAVIEETSALALAGTGRSITLSLELALDARFGLIRKVPLQQVLLNLMRNAVEAMTEAESPVRQLTVTTRRDGEDIEIRVADTGPGLPETVRTRLFEPFVTTKSQGLGVGLSICRTIVEAWGSAVRLVETGPSGTVFAFVVPAPPEPLG